MKTYHGFLFLGYILFKKHLATFESNRHVTITVTCDSTVNSDNMCATRPSNNSTYLRYTYLWLRFFLPNHSFYLSSTGIHLASQSLIILFLSISINHSSVLVVINLICFYRNNYVTVRLQNTLKNHQNSVCIPPYSRTENVKNKISGINKNWLFSWKKSRTSVINTVNWCC